jgi:hypothetical protein
MILAEEAVKNEMMMAPYLNQYITVSDKMLQEVLATWWEKINIIISILIIIGKLAFKKISPILKFTFFYINRMAKLKMQLHE